MKKHEDSNAVTLACTPAHRHQCPLPRYLNTHHSPCPCRSSSPHASHGLGVLCTPHTSVSANICSLSLHTPHAKDVSTGTYSSPTVCSVLEGRGGRGAWEGVVEQRATSLKVQPSGAGSGGWSGGDKSVRCRGAPPNPAGARGPRVHLSSYYCNKSELYYMKGKMNYRR